MNTKHLLIRFSIYVAVFSLLSLVLQATTQVLGQFLVLPLVLPLLMLSLVFNNMGQYVGYLDVDSGPIAAYIFRGLATGLFWGGCIAFSFDMYRRSKEKKYKIVLISLSVYALLIVLAAGALFLMLANSGWTD